MGQCRSHNGSCRKGLYSALALRSAAYAWPRGIQRQRRRGIPPSAGGAAEAAGGSAKTAGRRCRRQRCTPAQRGGAPRRGSAHRVAAPRLWAAGGGGEEPCAAVGPAGGWQQACAPRRPRPRAAKPYGGRQAAAQVGSRCAPAPPGPLVSLPCQPCSSVLPPACSRATQQPCTHAASAAVQWRSTQCGRRQGGIPGRDAAAAAGQARDPMLAEAPRSCLSWSGAAVPAPPLQAWYPAITSCLLPCCAACVLQGKSQCDDRGPEQHVHQEVAASRQAAQQRRGSGGWHVATVLRRACMPVLGPSFSL